MPELPEIENVVRSLAPHIAGRRIVTVRFLSPLAANRQPDELAGRLRARKIEGVRRVGKYLVFDLDEGVLTVHLRMTGRLLWNGVDGPFTRASLELDRGRLLFDDVRQFGRLTWSETLEEKLGRLGPDPFELEPAAFARLLKGRRGRLKPLLLNQEIVSGLGNIYVDEALFRAGLHPLASTSRVSGKRAQALHAAIVEVLREAIAAGGSSISDYVDAEGRAGSFQRFHRVYGREGKPCPSCGTAIRRIVVAQRGTHYCPRCQRKSA